MPIYMHNLTNSACSHIETKGKTINKPVRIEPMNTQFFSSQLDNRNVMRTNLLRTPGRKDSEKQIHPIATGQSC